MLLENILEKLIDDEEHSKRFEAYKEKRLYKYFFSTEPPPQDENEFVLEEFTIDGGPMGNHTRFVL